MTTTPAWTLQEAKNRFSAVVEAALGGSTQWVTRRGKPAVVVLSVEEYQRLCARTPAGTGSLVDHLLALPQDDGEFERAEVAPRDFLP
ncbi:MAG: type II toxin-antitoxin system Phd/YefM family antitoxin [Candidatus Competibacteraceae bacterium]|nr:type II toxin-antitoxin system Phd/YefM family antitoxin [Candidatus Competibacteraceae bacterium]